MEKFLDTSCNCDILKSSSAFYISAARNINPHAAYKMFHPSQNWMFQPDDVPLNTSRVQKLQVHQNLVVFLCLIYNKPKKYFFRLFVWIWLEYKYKIQEKCRLLCLVLNVRVILVMSTSYLKHSGTSSVLLVPEILSAISYKTAARWNCAEKGDVKDRVKDWKQ